MRQLSMHTPRTSNGVSTSPTTTPASAMRTATASSKSSPQSPVNTISPPPASSPTPSAVHAPTSSGASDALYPPSTPVGGRPVTETTLKTDLSAFTVSRGPGDDPTSFVIASYWAGCPVSCDRTVCCLPPFSAPLTTHLLSVPSVRPWEPGVHYRLPPGACAAMGLDGPLSLIPLRVEIEHVPYTAVRVDEHNRMVQLGGEGDESVYSTVLAYGSHTLCGLFPTETAEKWAALPRLDWSLSFVGALKRRYGVDASWLRSLSPGPATVSYDMPLLERAVDVRRETV
nr:MAG TPA: hypothetical protein [Caudoviricetes sp.]